MIKFFRKIRHKLMEKGKTGIYFKYAFGEIVLVVIGILIALSLNNWNEKRTQAANFDKLIDALEDEIIENLEEANYEIDWAREVQMNASKILLNEVSRKEFLKERSLRSIIELNRLDINSDDASSLVKRQEDFPEDYKALIPHLKNYLKKEERYYIQNADYGKQIAGYIDFLIKSQSWYSGSYIQVLDSIALNQQVDFYLTNPIFKNYLASYLDGYIYALREMIGVRSACLVILAEIKRIRGDSRAKDIIALFKKYNVTPFPQQACDNFDVAISELNEASTYLPLFNASDEIKHIKWRDELDNVSREIQLNPGELKINPATHRMKLNVLIEVISEEECTMKYQAKRNGFLLIQ
jgi:uncharacterized protein DUF6090